MSTGSSTSPKTPRTTYIGRHRFLEQRMTRDERVPLSADDPEMENGWSCVPVPPDNDPSWFILDATHDRRTTWGRWHFAEGCA
jgi:hypothetical protein